MVVHAHNPRTWGMGQKDPKFKNSLKYILSLRPAWKMTLSQKQQQQNPPSHRKARATYLGEVNTRNETLESRVWRGKTEFH